MKTYLVTVIHSVGFFKRTELTYRERLYAEDLQSAVSLVILKYHTSRHWISKIEEIEESKDA